MMIKSNDKTVFRNLYEEVFSVLMKVAFHITYNSDISEEICQDAFMRFYDKEISFNTLDEAKFYLIRITKNLAINYLRKKMKEAAFTDAVNGVSEKDGASQLIENESVVSVRKAVAKLPENYKTVIVLREYADLSYEEISSVLHISESNVKIRIYRARKALEEVLSKEEVYVSG